MRVAESSAAMEAAEAVLLKGCRDVMATASAGQDLTMEQRARFRRDQAYAVLTGAEAAEKLLRACGAAGIFDDFEIQRCYLDAWTAASHIGTTWDAAASQYAQVVMGVGKPDLLAWI